MQLHYTHHHHHDRHSTLSAWIRRFFMAPLFLLAKFFNFSGIYVIERYLRTCLYINLNFTYDWVKKKELSSSYFFFLLFVAAADILIYFYGQVGIYTHMHMYKKQEFYILTFISMSWSKQRRNFFICSLSIFFVHAWVLLLSFL